MKIETTGKSEFMKRIEDVEYGETFMYDRSLHMKIKDSINDANEGYSCIVDLRRNTINYIRNTDVRIIKNIKIVIDREEEYEER